MKKLLYITLSILAIANTSFGQLVATTNSNAAQLAQALSGTGVRISNVTFTGPNGSAGTFNATNSTLGMANGIMLTTGTFLMHKAQTIIMHRVTTTLQPVTHY